jgi:5-oxoprolinase (ATP-hydrolysing)
VASTNHWQFWIDVGGTFTDCIARRPNGSLATHKLLSSGIYKGQISPGSTSLCIRDAQRSRDPDDFFTGYSLRVLDDVVPVTRSGYAPSGYAPSGEGELHLARSLPFEPLPGTPYELFSDDEAPITGMRWLMGKPRHEEIGAVEVKLGTTRSTNALLERQGAVTALVTTAGFRDVLRIGFQNRARLFDLHVQDASPLYSHVVELRERLDSAGHVLQPLDEDHARQELQTLKQSGIGSLAVCLLHAYRNDAHERLVESIARQAGFEHVSLSSRLSPLPRIVPRGDTTVVDAYLTPVLRAYCERLQAQAPQAKFQFMTSAGGLTGSAGFSGKDSILSGPAGGVVGAVHVAREVGFSRIIGFDMGGTSTDVSRFDGEYERRYEMELSGAQGSITRIVAPMLAVETVAAGGGSICAFDGQKPVVGPRSAGSTPGPACYGSGGPLCVTDINLFLGRVLPEFFPFALHRSAVEARLDELIEQIQSQSGKHYTREELAAGLNTIANANMAAPIRRISIARGYDVRDYTLVSFGGAGAQHACAVAQELGMTQVLCSPHAGVLSALGIGVADVTRLGERAVGQILHELDVSTLDSVFASMENELRAQILEEGIAPQNIEMPRRLLDIRYVGQETRITVAQPADGDYRNAFEQLHRQLYGFHFAGRDVEVYAARVELSGHTQKPRATHQEIAERQPQPDHMANVFFGGSFQQTEVYQRHNLQAGNHVNGPAIIVEENSTIVVEPGWRAQVLETSDILLRYEAGHAEAGHAEAGQVHDMRANKVLQDDAPPDPIELELFNNRFASVAEQMGTMLQRTALSTNVKERLDFSCAVFTSSGDLVVNAPHIPVHLGAMSECVKCLIMDAGPWHRAMFMSRMTRFAAAVICRMSPSLRRCLSKTISAVLKKCDTTVLRCQPRASCGNWGYRTWLHAALFPLLSRRRSAHPPLPSSTQHEVEWRWLACVAAGGSIPIARCGR